MECVMLKNLFFKILISLSASTDFPSCYVGISIAQNKCLISLLYLLVNFISANSTPQILSLNEEQTFLF